ncbi:MAG: nuclear transport factor 2 family protein [Alphaproteobacteria bacterium]|nr:nuclear transport factor 2 family protein [Alphaproteobacteria bacterium]
MQYLLIAAMILFSGITVRAEDAPAIVGPAFFKVYDTFDFDAASAFMADDMVYEMPEHNLRVEGKGQILSNMKRDTSVWYDPDINDVMTFVNGPYFIRVSKGTAKTAGATVGLAVEEFVMPVGNVSILKIERGKIVLKRDYFDYSEGFAKIAAMMQK